MPATEDQNSQHCPGSLESLCLSRYLSYLEDEVVTFISLTQVNSKIFKPSLCRKLVNLLKGQLNSSLFGLPGGWLRECMLEKILSSEFPSPRHSRLASLRRRDELPENSEAFPLIHEPHVDAVGGSNGLICVNTCCAGAFIQEVMAGIVINSDVREEIITLYTEYAQLLYLCFNSDRMSPGSASCVHQTGLSGSSYSGLLPLNAPVILQHLFVDLETKGPTRVSQLQRLAFTEAFVREEDSTRVDQSDAEEVADQDIGSIGGAEIVRQRKLIAKELRRRETLFLQSFAPLQMLLAADASESTSLGNSTFSHHPDCPAHNGSHRHDVMELFSDQMDEGVQQCVRQDPRNMPRGDRLGLALTVLVMFREMNQHVLRFTNLTEIVLKNNVQCELYSKANFQFEFLARIGLCCPRLRVLDIFGTDTWADCLVAFFFKDAFHSLHRYLFFMENEEDESSSYHPHDTTRYCQFCLDQLHPNCIEKPMTINPVIPLLDEVYDHVVKKYPKRSACILRNCVKLTDLLNATTANVFELLREGDANSRKASDLETDALTTDVKSAESEEESDAGIKSRLRSSRKRHMSMTDLCLAEAKVPRNFTTTTLKTNHTTHKRRQLVKSLYLPKASKKRTRRIISQPVKDEIISSSLSEPLPYSGPGGSGVNSTVKGLSPLTLTSPTELYPPGEALQQTSTTTSPSVMTRARKKLLSLTTETTTAAASQAELRNTRQKGQEKNSGRHTCTSARSRAGGSKQDAQRVGNTLSTVAPTSGAGISDTLPQTLSYSEWEEVTLKCYCEGKEKCNEKTEIRLSRPGWEQSNNRIRCKSVQCWSYIDRWSEPETVSYREVREWPHLNPCVKTLEVLNIGGTNVLGEFIPFILLNAPKLKSLGQWINTMIYGVEILRKLPGQEKRIFPNIQEFSYSSDRNYFCQAYIGFVPESPVFKRVRREMVRFSGKVAPRIKNAASNAAKLKQIDDDMALMSEVCPELRKLNLVLHYKTSVVHGTSEDPQNYQLPVNDDDDDDDDETIPELLPIQESIWNHLAKLDHLIELDLVTMKFCNVRTLLQVIGPKLQILTVEMDEEQGNGSEICHIARCCPELTSLRLLLGDKVLRGEMMLQFEAGYFSKLHKLNVVGTLHVHAFAFLWGYCRVLRILRVGLVVSNYFDGTNALIDNVLCLVYRFNPMIHLEELHIKNLRIRSLTVGKLLLQKLPRLQKASLWLIDLDQGAAEFKRLLSEKLRNGFRLEYKYCSQN